eukprot:TRINITY_DN15127_c0_g1_i1.p1 TRINITY_DN15127_c0_g1~~TRINITY_DN15127_c0_g1_i1.p1  ORF type:complete len:171 (+),score=23.47 TRINITY_DN15127_c0_g1_i1:94-606(+)
MRQFTREYVVQYPWDQVTLASWKKYPNPMSPHVISVDITDRNVDPTTGVLHSERLIATQLNIPRWLHTVSGGDTCFVAETSRVDPSQREMTLETNNISFSGLMSVHEVCTYSPHPENEKWTIFRQTVTVKAFTYGVASAVEHWCINRYLETSQKGKDVIDSVCARLFSKS